MNFSDDERDAGPSFSLSDLIYSQATFRKQNPAAVARPTQKISQQTLARDKFTDKEDGIKEEERLDYDVYGISSQSPPMTPSARNMITTMYQSSSTRPIATTTTTATILRKLKRKRKYQNEPDYETQSVTDARQRRLEELIRYRRIRQRWLQKTLSMVGEMDVGGAVECMARKIIPMKRHGTRTQPDEQSTSHDGPERFVSEVPTLLPLLTQMDRSEDERILHLGSLLISEDDPKDVSMNGEQDDMDYYQQGYSAPRKRDLDFYYGTEHVPLVKQPMANEDDKSYPQLDKFPYLFRPAISYRHMRYQSSAVRGHYFRERTQRSLTAMYLAGCSGLDPSMDHRLLQGLHQSEANILFPLNREQLVLQQANDQALDLQSIRSRRWKDKSYVVAQLNIDSTKPILVGHSLDPSSMREARRLKRNKFVDMYGGSPIDDISCEDVHVIQPESLPSEQDDIGEDSTNGSDGDDSSYCSSEAVSSQPSRATAVRPESIVVIPEHPQHSTPQQYLHIAGTKPPVPMFPLDESGIVFGREDSNAQIARGCQIEASTWTLTTSALLCQLGAARARGDGTTVQNIHELLLSYVERLPALNRKDPTKIKWLIAKGVKDLPMLPYYHSFMHQFSFVANSGTFRESIGRAKAYDEEDDDDHDPVLFSSLGNQISEALEAYLKHHCLKTFPRLHLVYAVASVARHLPSSAAEIISRPLNDRTTPFDLVRQTLVHMEENQMLTDDMRQLSSSSMTKMHVGQMEYFFHQATTVLQDCVAMDSYHESEYACWHLAFLAGSLLLSSGNQIGSGAHVLPSSKKARNLEDMFSQEDIMTPKHEIRKVFPKFTEIRQRVASALRDMLRSSNDYLQIRKSQAMCSLLEWSDVIALTVGPSWERPNQGIDPWKQICLAHAHQLSHWSSAAPSSSTSACIIELGRRKATSMNSILTSLAATLENNPGKIQHWRRLVNELGPVGVKVSKEQRIKCGTCSQCRGLRKGLQMDHSAQQSPGWWGTERAFWTDQILSSSIPKRHDSDRPSSVHKVRQLIEQSLHHVDDDLDDNALTTDLTYILPEYDLSWIGNIHGSEDDKVTISRRKREAAERMELYDNELPASLKDILLKSNRKQRSFEVLPPVVPNVLSICSEILCYKIFLACHLQGGSSESVGKLTWQLTKACVDGSTILEESDSWLCLLWLSRQGLCIPQLLLDFHKRLVSTPKQKQRDTYTQLEKSAMLECILLYGANCHTIWKAEVPTFKGWGYKRIVQLFCLIRDDGKF